LELKKIYIATGGEEGRKDADRQQPETKYRRVLHGICRGSLYQLSRRIKHAELCEHRKM
jgi:hypothetical protein